MWWRAANLLQEACQQSLRRTCTRDCFELTGLADDVYATLGTEIPFHWVIGKSLSGQALAWCGVLNPQPVCLCLSLSSSLPHKTKMVFLETPNRYYSREGLLNFLRKKFGDHEDFKINQVGDSYFSFQAPRELTAVSITVLDR